MPRASEQTRADAAALGADPPAGRALVRQSEQTRADAAALTGGHGAASASPPGAPAGEVLVFVTSHPSPCGGCGKALERGDLLRLEGDQALCPTCAGLGDLVILPSGDAALTRRTSKYSQKRAVILRWSRERKRYERRGTLVEPAALERAQAECAQDAETRAKQRERAAARREVDDRAFVAAFTQAIHAQFPGCPLAEARDIAAHACAKYSGRVGRTAAAKELEPEAVRLAVIAHVRHLHTDYDRLVDRTRDKRDARAQVRDRVQAVLRAWEQPHVQGHGA